MTEVRVGFIGAGGIASRHVGDLLGFSDVKVVAFADPAIERAQEQAARTGGQAYTDYRQMLDKEHLDAIYICLPPFAHGEPEESALEMGIPFFVEKPLAVDEDTAGKIARGVEDKGLVTAVGYHWRYLDTTEQAQELLAKNPARLALGYWLDSTPPPPWWRKQEQSGGQMVEQTTHIFDLARLLVGEVNTVYAVGSTKDREAFPDLNVLDVSAATLTFATGAVGTMASTCLLNWPHRIGLHLFSEGMAIEMSEFELMVDTGRGRPVTHAQGDPFVREDRDFIDAVQGKANKIRSPYAEAMKTHLLTVTANRSVHEGRALPIERSI
ncbi:MAG: Gfo/Idh/MocA family oxidoreductase [Chloroflexota bacterium]|nr:Gfo/Idh/MocA family oxidoreductase [Chloroflexota bacterium]